MEVLSIIGTIFSALAALCAVVSPIITTKINNKHALKLKQMEINHLGRDKAIKDFLSCYGAYFAFRQPTDTKELCSTICVLMAYSTDKLSSALQNLLAFIDSNIDDDVELTKRFSVCEKLIRETFTPK